MILISGDASISKFTLFLQMTLDYLTQKSSIPLERRVKNRSKYLPIPST
ncbi:MAG: hypothetical protein ACMUEM_07515 [Flavobacteriales bacterium AspAUS03]